MTPFSQPRRDQEIQAAIKTHAARRKTPAP